MVYYTDEPPGVNKRAVAGYYLFLCLIGFAVLLGPTGSGIPITLIGNELRDDAHPAYPGTHDDPSDCSAAECHPNEYGNWTDTHHATHMYYELSNDSYRIGAEYWVDSTEFNTSCAECHTSGYNATDDSWERLGVDCFNCHGGSPLVDYSGESCNPCHLPSGADHPHQMTAWENSAHANSLTDLRSSDHAASYCMHCMGTEGFIDQQAGGHATFEVNDTTINSISCPACHAVHANWSSNEGQIRAASTPELCGLCHVGDRHTTYQTWTGGPHALAGVECIDCHGYDIANVSRPWTQFLNHTFLVNLDLACGQTNDDPGCHEGMDAWAVAQLETYQASYEDLTEEIAAEVAAFGPIVEAYNETAGANHTLANYVLDMIDEADAKVFEYNADGSHGFHHPHQIFGELNGAYADLLDAKALFYEMTGTGGGGGISADMLIIVGGAAGGIVVGLLLGVLVGRRR